MQRLQPPGWPLRFAGLFVALLLCLAPMAARAQAQHTLRFVVTFAPSVMAKPFTGRVLVLLARPGGREPRLGPSWFGTQPFFAVDVKGAKPGAPIVLDDRALGYPGPLSTIPAGEYAAQAVLDLRADSHDIGTDPGNAYSTVVTQTLDPKVGGDVLLRVDRIVPARRFPESDRVKLVDIPSALLSRFHGHPVRMRAGVVLPDGYDADTSRRWPVVYIIPGFGGDHYQTPMYARFLSVPAILVVLDPDAPTGHHVFADSANNGPWGKALTTELIPYIEKTYRAVGKPHGRLLTGHSSGGWSSLWLQVTYPDFFGGTWSTSPDPVDFRDFQRINLYAPGENMFTDRQGNPRPLARQGEQPVLFYKPFSDMETVLGHGGQLGSFEAVFSPRGADGQPLKLWDRKTGAINPAVAKAWEKYDISLTLERNWPALGPKLASKLHVITGGLDTFYLEGAVKLLKERLAKLGSDAVVEIVPGKDHGTVLTPELRERIGREMMETFERGQKAAAAR